MRSPVQDFRTTRGGLSRLPLRLSWRAGRGRLTRRCSRPLLGASRRLTAADLQVRQLAGIVRMAKSERRLPLWYLVPPFVALVLVWPIIVEMPPLRRPSNLNAVQVILVVPFYLGLAAAPGWLYAWAGHYERGSLSRSQRVWVSTSLWTALLASIGGSVTIFAVIPFPAVVGSLMVSVFLLRRYYRSTHHGASRIVSRSSAS